MRRLFVASTLAFWVAVVGFWATHRWSPQQLPAMTAGEQRSVTLAELALHVAGTDCWMAIDGQVYDLSSYIPDHPAEPEILLPWCGKEATHAYKTKMKGRPHSARADAMLPRYRVGVLAAQR